VSDSEAAAQARQHATSGISENPNGNNPETSKQDQNPHRRSRGSADTGA
jgi:hypothetical protein